MTAADHLRICEAKRGGATEQERELCEIRFTVTDEEYQEVHPYSHPSQDMRGVLHYRLSRPRPVRRLYPHFSAYPGAHPLSHLGEKTGGTKEEVHPGTPPSSGGEQAHKGQKWIVRDNPTLRASPPAAPMATASQLPLSATAPAAAPRATKAKYQLASF